MSIACCEVQCAVSSHHPITSTHGSTAQQGGDHSLLPSAVVSFHTHPSPPCQPPARTGTAPQGSDPLVLHSAVVSRYHNPSPPCQPLARTGTAPQRGGPYLLPNAVVPYPPIPRLLVSPSLTQILHHREVTSACCPVQWCAATPIPRLHIHLCSIHHSLHNLQLASFACLKKATTMGQVLGLITATFGISQVQLPAPRIDVLTKSVQGMASKAVKTSNSGSAWCAYGHRLGSLCDLISLLESISQ